MDVAVEDRGNVTLLRIDGAIDMLNSVELRELMNRTLSEKRTKVVVDMDKVPHIDSSGLAILIKWATALHVAGGGLRLFGVPQHIRKVMGEGMPIFESEVVALKDFA